jgi:amino acid transporter
VSTFLTYYIDIAIFIFVWVIAFCFSRSGIIALHDIDLSEIHDVDREKVKISALPGGNVSWWHKWVV